MRSTSSIPSPNSAHPVIAWSPWLIIAGASFIALFCSIVFQRVWGADYWWQLATGRYVLSQGIPETDQFSYTPGDKPWIELRWMYCTGLSWLVDHFGVQAAVAIKAVGVTVAFCLVALVPPRRAGMLPRLMVVTFAILACSHRMFLRPEVVTFLLFALVLWMLDAWRRTGTRWVWLIPLIQVIWANSHTLFAMGPVLVGLSLFCEVLRVVWARWRTGTSPSLTPPLKRPIECPSSLENDGSRVLQSGLLLVATCLACLAQPYGMAGAIFPFQLLRQIQGTVFKEFIGEFFPLYAFSFSIPAVTYFTVLLVLALLTALINIHRLNAFAALICLATGYLAITAIRNTPLFALASVYFILDNLGRSGHWQRFTAALVSQRLHPVAAMALAAFCTYQSWWIATDRASLQIKGVIQFGWGLAEREYPIRAEQFLRNHSLPTPILNTQMEGAYLLAHGHRVFIDPRLEVYGEERYARYLAIVQTQEAFDDTVRELDVRTLFIDNHSRVIERARSAGWALVYFDEKAAIYVRPDSLGDVRPIASANDFARQVSEVRTFFPSPIPRDKLGLFERAVAGEPYLYTANLLRVCGQPALAEGFLVDALRANPALSEARRGLERVRAILKAQREQR